VRVNRLDVGLRVRTVLLIEEEKKRKEKEKVIMFGLRRSSNIVCKNGMFGIKMETSWTSRVLKGTKRSELGREVREYVASRGTSTDS
jgi:hypothetical protein